MAKKQPPKQPGELPVEGLRASILEQKIPETLEHNYMPYAMSVIVSRAIPEIDGFKPSHRKLLYTMYKMGLLTGARTKSANVVGQTMRLNPHGESAIYETMVRLSRGYQALLHPLVDSKGNFGKTYSRDMAYAASRYTEVKLDAICHEFFRDIDHDTVDFMDNYDNTMKEPVLLPTVFPNVLVAANQGIAVGMASQICGFNLAEVCQTTVAYMKNPQHDLLTTLPAPDFSTGGELIYDPDAMRNIYETGRGSFPLRAKYRFTPKENIIEIYEIPYTTTIEAIMDKVAEHIKSGKIKEISDMRDETGLSGLKLAIDCKRGTDPDKLMQKLFKLTPLRDSFSCNFNILIAGTPFTLGVRSILDEWIAWRMEGVRRKLHFDLNKLRDKLHLLLGLQKILLDIDRAIRIVRETDEEADVLPNLMIGFGIDLTQAEYIAEIKLRNLNKQYILTRLKEVESLKGEIASMEDILASKQKMQALIIRDLEAVQKKYASPRKTDLVYETDLPAYDPGEQIEDYPVHLFISRQGYLKKITPQSLRMSGEQKYKDQDGPFLAYETANRDELLVFTNKAQAYKIRTHEFEETKASQLGDYLPAKLGFADEEAVRFVCPMGDGSGHLLFFFENGKAARVPLSSYETKSNRKKLTGAYSDKSPLTCVLLLREDQELFVQSSDGRCLLFHTAALAPKTTRNTQGVGVMAVKGRQRLEQVCPIGQISLQNPQRFRVKSLPAAGLVLREQDKGVVQLSLEE